MLKIAVDTDICLDLLSGRQPFNQAAEQLFRLAELGKITICVSSLSFANIDYILQSQYKRKDSRYILANFKSLVELVSIGDQIIQLAIHSTFNDFEDAIQYYAALENNIGILITRNLKDYKNSIIEIMNPETFLAGIH